MRKIRVHGSPPMTVEELLAWHAKTFGTAVMVGDADGDDGEDDDSDDSGDGDDGDTGSEGSGNNDSGKDDDASGAVVPLELHEKTREKMRRADQRAAAAEQKLREIEDKDKPELERAQARVAELEPRVKELETTISDLRINNAFLASNSFTWHDPEDALRLADMSSVEIDDDGKVTGLDAALKDLAKRKPHLVRSTDGSGNDDGSSSGSTMNGNRKGNKANLDHEALAKKYPALRR